MKIQNRCRVEQTTDGMVTKLYSERRRREDASGNLIAQFIRLRANYLL